VSAINLRVKCGLLLPDNDETGRLQQHGQKNCSAVNHRSYPPVPATPTLLIDLQHKIDVWLEAKNLLVSPDEINKQEPCKSVP